MNDLKGAWKNVMRTILDKFDEGEEKDSMSVILAMAGLIITDTKEDAE